MAQSMVLVITDGLQLTAKERLPDSCSFRVGSMPSAQELSRGLDAVTSAFWQGTRKVQALPPRYLVFGC